MDEIPKRCCQEAHSRGYKEGFNKAIDPTVREAMLKNNPIILATPIDHTKVMAAFDKRFSNIQGREWNDLGYSYWDISETVKAFIQSALKGEI